MKNKNKKALLLVTSLIFLASCQLNPQPSNTGSSTSGSSVADPDHYTEKDPEVELPVLEG